MNKKDYHILESLYSELKMDDYFLSESSNFDWDKFFTQKYGGNYSVFLIEDFQKSETRPTKDGEEDVYDITLADGSEFQLFMNYVTPEKSKNFMRQSSMNLSHKGRNDLAELYDKFFNEESPHGSVCFIQFKDAEERHNITGNVGILAIELFAILRNAILDSFSSGKMEGLKGLIIRVNNDESKRIKLYQKLIKKYLTQFNNVFIDDFSEKEKYITLVIATK